MMGYYCESIQNIISPFSYLPHRPCTKTHQDVVLVKQQSPINPITDFENHLHVNHAPPSCHTTGGHLSYGEKGEITYEDATQHGNSLRPTYNMTLPMFVIGNTTEFLVADVLLDVFKSMSRRSSDSFKRYWRSLGEIALKPRLELTSLLVNACRVTRSDLGVNLLHTIRPPPWRFVKFFVHPSQVTI